MYFQTNGYAVTKIGKWSVVIMLLCVLVSCGNKQQDKNKKQVADIDTTALGREIQEISRKIGQNPDDAALIHERAKLHLQRKDIGNAMLDMEKVMQLDTTKAEYFLTLADLHFAANKTARSKAALEKCLSIDPNNKTAMEKLAELYFYVKQYDQALSYLDKILKDDIHDSKAYFMKGMVFKEKGDTARAISSFQTSIEQNKDFYDSYQQIGILYTAKNNPIAKQYFDGALRLNAKSEEALYGRAMCYQEVMHDYDKAIQDYTSITLINPKNSKAYFALGYIHFQYLKVYSEALKYYDKAITNEPGWPEAFFNRGLCYESMGDINAAKSDYRRALELRPDYRNAQIGLQRVSAMN